MKIVFRQLFKLDLEFIKLAGATGLEPVWAEAGGFGDRCNRRYAKPLCTRHTFDVNGNRTRYSVFEEQRPTNRLLHFQVSCCMCL